MKRRNNKNDRTTQATPYRIERLEQRVLFSADMPFIAEGPATPQPEQVQVLTSSQTQAQQQEAGTPSRFEVVIIDAATPDYQSIVDDLQQRSDADFAIYLLDSNADGIDQIDTILAEHDDVSAVHLITHGADGEITLGNDSIDFVDLLADASTIGGWQETFTTDGDFLIYGCDLAATQAGQHFVETLAQLTGADVAASTDLTGAAILGGDWQLEYSTGSVETDVAMSTEFQSNYQHTLATYTVSNTADSGAGSLRQAILDANANPNTDLSTPDQIVFDIGVDGSQQTIRLNSPLDPINEAVIVDGFSQYGALTPTVPIIEINGADAGTVDGITLAAGSDGSTIRGLVINRFGDSGIKLVDSNNHTIVGNYIGTDTAGTADFGNSVYGIEILNSANNQIGGSTATDRNVIGWNGDDGISLYGASTTNNVVQGNYVGVDFTGDAAAGNLSNGIKVSGGASNNTIGGDRTAGEGNVLSSNSASGSDGITISGAGTDDNKVYGNYIGTNHDGTVAMGNARHGVVIYDGAQGTQIGGTGTGEGNIISGNVTHGVVIDGNDLSLTTGNVVQGNIIGLNATGTAILGNGNSGINIFGGADANTIGGTTTAARNVISGNVDGIYIQDADGITIQGNYIGTDITGLVDLGNSDRGVQLESGANNTVVGGTTAPARNVISGNDNDGIIISDGANPGAGTTGTLIHGNYIGVGADSTTAVGNGTNGVRITTEDNHTIGGTADGAGNVIAHNGGDGVMIQNSSATGNSILANSIYANAQQGIDLGDNGTTTNDPSDVDSGSNNLQNFPEIEAANTDGVGTITVSATLDSAANTTYRIEFFASSAQDGSGYGEAERYLGFATVTTDDSGNTKFSELLSAVVATGEYVTATATVDLGGGNYGDTSEFSANVAAVAAANSAPTTTGLFDVTLNEDPGFSFVDLKARFADAEDTDLELVYTITSNTNPALFDSVSINASGVLSLDYAADQNGTGDITIRATDTGGLFVETTFTVTLNAVNDAPVRAVGIVSDLVVNEDSGLTSLGLGSVTYSPGGGADESAQALTYEVTVIPDPNFFGKIFLADGTTQVTTGFYSLDDIRGMQFAPEPDENGGPSFFSYRVVDSGGTPNGGSDTFTETIRLDITPENDAPVVATSGGSTSYIEQAPAVIVDSGLTLSDPDGFDGADPSDQFVGVVAITGNYAAGDILGFTDTANIQGNLVGNILSLSVVSGQTATVAEFEAAMQSVTFFNGGDAPSELNRTVSFSFDDGVDSSNVATKSLQFNALNDDPTNTGSLPSDVAVTEDTMSSVDLSSVTLNDPDAGNNLITVTLNTSTGGNIWASSDFDVTVYGSGSSTLTLVGGVNDLNNFFSSSSRFQYLHGTQHITGDNADTIQVSVNDNGSTGTGGGGTILLGTVNVDITSVNDNPIISSPNTFDTAENTTAVGTVTTTDADGGAPQYTLVGAVDDGLFSIDINTGVLTFNSAPDFEAPTDAGADNVYNLTVQVNDGNGGIVNQAIAVTVTNVNENTATAIVDTNLSADGVSEDANLGDTVGITAYSSDADPGDTITYTLDDDASGLFTIDTNTGIVTVNGVLDYESATTHEITVRATSTDTSFTTRTFTIALGDVNEAPTDLTTTATTHGGVSLNNDGGNDTYFVADNGSTLLGGLTTVTIETSFSITAPGADLSPLLSYASGTNDESLALFLKSDGRIWFGADSNGSPIASTVGNYPELFDGEVHHVGVTWDSATGNVDFYIDGELVESITGYQTGHSVAAGGELVFGQDQDSVLGGFRTIDVFSGTIYDVRIFDDVRTPAEIATNYDVTLPNTEAGMIANWTFNDLSSNGIVVDTVSGNNLTKQQVIGPGFSSSTPELSLEVREDAANGDVIGTILAIDTDAGDTRDYTLLDDAGGRFQIDSSTGTITLIDDALIDFESATSHNITVQVTDSGFLTYNEVFTIDVIDVNESPTFTSAPVTAATEDTLYSYTFTTDDVDGDGLSFTGITVPPWLTLVDNGNGTATLSGTPTNAEVGGHTIDVQVSDGALTTNQSFTLTVANVNDDPVFSSPNTFNVAENSTAVGTVTTSDVDGGAPQYTLVGVVDDGLFSIDINTGVLTFNTAPDFEAPADTGADNVYNLTVQVDDGDGGIVNQAIAVNVTNVNENTTTAIVDTNLSADGVSEDANLGDTVGITAYSNDADPGDTITYTLDDDAGGLFTIDTNSGVVTVNGVLDYETDTSLDITVRATSTDTSFTTRTFTIDIGDVNDNPPVVTPGQVFNINEDANIGDAVGTVGATDADTVGSLQSWTITNGNADGIFQIDGATGAITIASTTSLNFEATNQYTLSVQVGDGLNTSATETLVIDINDVNEAPTFTSTPDTSATEDTLYSYTFTTNDVDGDGLSFTAITVPPWLTLVDNGNGTATLSGTPTNAEVGGHTIDVQVSDGALTTNQSFTLTVANVNDDPVFSSPNTFNTAENTTAVGTVTTTDVDGSAPQYTLVGAVDDGLFSIDFNTGVLSFTVGPDFESPADSGGDNVYNLTVQVDDGNGGVVNQAIAVTVTNVNETGASPISDTNVAPEAVNEDASIGDAVGITASSNDADAGDSITYTLDDDANGLFTIDGNTGVVTVNGALDYESATSHSITVRATSTDTSFTTQGFTIAIGDVNDNLPVVTAAQTFNVNEDAVVNDAVGVVLATDADSVGSLQNWTITNGNADGIFAIDANTGVITIASTTNLNFEATSQYTLTVQVGDGVNTSATETLIIAINDVNEAPTFSSTPITSATEDSAYSYTITTNDVDGDGLSFTAITVPPWLTLVDNGNGTATLSGTPTNAEVGGHSIDVQVSDGALTTNQSFTLTVASVNDDPVFSSPNTFNTAENTTVVGTVTTTGVDGGAPQYTLVGAVDDGLFSIDINTGALTFNSAPDFEAPADNGGDNVYNLTVQVNDGNGGIVNQNIAVTVTNVNESGASPISDTNVAPEAVNEDASIGDAVGITAFATDADTDDNILYSLDDDAGGLFTIDANSGIVTVNGVLDYETNTSLDITVRATSTDTSFTTRTFTIDIGDVNDNPPFVTPGQVFNINEDVAADNTVGTVLATDADTVGSLQNWTITAGNTDGIFMIDGNTGDLIIADNTNLNFEATNQYTLTVQVGDGINTSATQTLTININNVNEAPTRISLDNASVDETTDTSLGFPVGTLAAADPDSGETFTFAIVGGLDADVFTLGGPQNAELILTDGVLDFEMQDSYEVTIRSTDAGGLSIDRTFDISVNDLNDAPQVVADTLATTEDVPLTIDVLTDLLGNDRDADGDQLTLVDMTQPAHGVLANNSDGTWTYSPDANYNGDDQFQYEITDTNGATHQGTVTIVVQAANDAPTLTGPNSTSIVENTDEAQLQIIASDIEDDPVALRISGGADRDAFSLDTQTGTLTFTGTPDFESPHDADSDNRYEVEILVTDSHGASTSQLIAVTVTNANEAPNIAANPITSTELSTGTIGSVTVGDPDLGDALTLTITGGTGAANFSIDTDTGEIIQDNPTSAGMYTLEVQVTDQQGVTSNATLNITVQASTESPAEPNEPEDEFETSASNDDTASAPVFEVDGVGSEPGDENTGVSNGDGPQEGATQAEIASNQLTESSISTPIIPQFTEFQLNPTNPTSQIDHGSSQRPAYDLVLELLLEEADDLTGMAVQHSDLQGTQVSVSLTPAMLDALEQMRFNIDQQHDSASQQLELIAGVGTVTSLSLTAGFVTWLLRTGSLLATALSTTPLWRKFDPIPILANINIHTHGAEDNHV